MNHEIWTTARTLIVDGRGIPAADDTPGTLTRRLGAPGIGAWLRNDSPLEDRR